MEKLIEIIKGYAPLIIVIISVTFYMLGRVYTTSKSKKLQEIQKLLKKIQDVETANAQSKRSLLLIKQLTAKKKNNKKQ